VRDDIYERGVTGGALNLNSTGYPDHGRYGDLPLQWIIPPAEPRIEPETSWLVDRSSDHQATKLVRTRNIRYMKDKKKKKKKKQKNKNQEEEEE
jgi:hypothetical protein